VLQAICKFGMPSISTRQTRHKPAGRQVRKTLARWKRAGVRFVVAKPWAIRREDGSDFNDLLRQSGTGAVEVSGGSYARVATASATWNAASTGADPTTISNAATITFATATASWGNVVAFGLYDALTSGNLLAWDWLGNYQWLPCTISSASPGVITAHAHGYAAADPVVYTTVFGGTAPMAVEGVILVIPIQ